MKYIEKSMCKLKYSRQALVLLIKVINVAKNYLVAVAEENIFQNDTTESGSTSGKTKKQNV